MEEQGIFQNWHTPANEIEESRTLPRTFLRLEQTLYPSERLDAIPCQNLRFTQIPYVQEVAGFTKASHTTNQFEEGCETMSR